MGYPEISQCPLDFITRFHAHVLMNAFTFAFAYDMFGIFCEICRNQSMVPRFCYSDSCTCERQQDTQTWRHKERQQERLTDKQKHSYMSHPFSLFPFHAKPGLTRPKRGLYGHRMHAKVGLPCSKSDNFIAIVFVAISAVQWDFVWDATSCSYCDSSVYISISNMLA